MYSGWVNDRDGCLAAIILLDQFSRHLFRRNDRAYALDAQAVLLSQSIFTNQTRWKEYKLYEKGFILMPLEHSENRSVNLSCVTETERLIRELEKDMPELFEEGGGRRYTEALLKFAKDSNEIVSKFGRFP